jgi:hypothetical protein
MTTDQGASAGAAATPATALGDLYQSIAAALTIAAQNAVAAQQQANITAQAATVQGVSTLYSLDTASTGEATAKALGEKG